MTEPRRPVDGTIIYANEKAREVRDKVREYEGYAYSVNLSLETFLRHRDDFPEVAQAALLRVIEARRTQDEILVGLLGIDPARLGLDPRQWRMRDGGAA